MVLVISEAVSTSEKLNDGKKKLKTKLHETAIYRTQPAVHVQLGLICCLL